MASADEDEADDAPRGARGAADAGKVDCVGTGLGGVLAPGDPGEAARARASCVDWALTARLYLPAGGLEGAVLPKGHGGTDRCARGIDWRAAASLDPEGRLFASAIEYRRDLVVGSGPW